MNFLLSLGKLVQNCVTLSRWFSSKTAAFYTEQCMTPSLFTTLKSHKTLETTHLSFGFICYAIYSVVRMYTKCLATNCNYRYLQTAWVYRYPSIPTLFPTFTVLLSLHLIILLWAFVIIKCTLSYLHGLFSVLEWFGT